MILLKKAVKRFAISLIVMLIVLPYSVINIFAASLGISVKDNGNGTYSVYLSPSSKTIEGSVSVASSGGVSSEVWCGEGRCEVATFKGIGTFTVTATPRTFTDMNSPESGDISVSGGSYSVTVANPSATNQKPPTTPTPEKPNQETPKKEEPKEETKSKVSTLSSLTISEGTLSPGFKSGTMEYKVSLPASAKSIKVDAKASDAKATVKGTGNHDLKVGDNTITVTGVAENGSTSVYTLKVYVDETPTAFAQFNDQKLGVVSNIDAVKAPTGFEKSKVKMDGKDVDAWTNNATKMTIVYLVNDKQEKDFYVYDEAKGVTSIFRPMALLGNNLILVDVPKEVQTKEGMNFTTVKVDNMDVPGWTFNEKALENYVVIYMMDENGKMNYYQYEKTENRLQLYSGAASMTQETYDAYVKEQEAKQDKLMMIIYCLSGLSVALLILAGVLFFRKKPNNKHQKIDVKEFDYGDSMHIEGNSMLDEEEKE